LHVLSFVLDLNQTISSLKMCSNKQANASLWKAPQESNEAKLRLYNSFTKKKELFIPINGNEVRWYSCGPTVYDKSHMGHAR